MEAGTNPVTGSVQGTAPETGDGPEGTEVRPRAVDRDRTPSQRAKASQRAIRSQSLNHTPSPNRERGTSPEAQGQGKWTPGFFKGVNLFVFTLEAKAKAEPKGKRLFERIENILRNIEKQIF